MYRNMLFGKTHLLKILQERGESRDYWGGFVLDEMKIQVCHLCSKVIVCMQLRINNNQLNNVPSSKNCM